MLHFRDCFQNTYICSHTTAVVQASALWNALCWRLVSDRPRRPSLSGIASFPAAGSAPRVPIDSSPITALSMAGEGTAHGTCATNTLETLHTSCGAAVAVLVAVVGVGMSRIVLG